MSRKLNMNQLQESLCTRAHAVVLDTLVVFGLGLVAFVSAIACGVLFAKLVCFVTKGKVNPSSTPHFYISY
jgi:Na+-transporting methylmalonyl-CoA/oxaloacetate decarboxylase beta subunit